MMSVVKLLLASASVPSRCSGSGSGTSIPVPYLRDRMSVVAHPFSKKTHLQKNYFPDADRGAGASARRSSARQSLQISQTSRRARVDHSDEIASSSSRSVNWNRTDLNVSSARPLFVCVVTRAIGSFPVARSRCNSSCSRSPCSWRSRPVSQTLSSDVNVDLVQTDTHTF